jgi:CTP:phosphocholine cytidylyltransferase-like protein
MNRVYLENVARIKMFWKKQQQISIYYIHSLLSIKKLLISFSYPEPYRLR